MQNKELKKIIKRTKIDNSYQYNGKTLYLEKIKYMVNNCKKILDIGKSSREWYSFFEEEQILTLDINKYEDYPDIIDDICNLKKVKPESFDGIICHAILEHVYSPESAMKNIYTILKKNGVVFSFLPFLWRYHAPNDLSYQDFYRFSRDGIAYLFRDFDKVTLYPVRGRFSTILNLFGGWKVFVENRIGVKINQIIDRIFRNKSEIIQVSGYNVWAIK